MPKIIQNLPDRLAEEARRQVFACGYSALTIRSVAAACGVGVGTVYNYYDSKEALVAAFMLQDWKLCLEAIDGRARDAQSAEPVLETMYRQLENYLQEYQAIFRDEGAAASFAGSFSRYHALLRSQLAQPLRRFCADDFTAEFTAEALLTWTVAGKPYRQIRDLLLKLL